MSLPDVKVELGLNAFRFTGGNFILDSDTLGVLGQSRLSGLEWYDVSQYVQGVQINRGRSRQLDYFQAGSATVSFYNGERLFDPLNQDSPYQGIEPKVLIRISSRGHWLFTGFINDWDFQYDIANHDTAVAKCSEAFSVLANQFLSAFTPSAELTGARINAVLNRSEVNLRGPRSIANGRSTLGAFAVDANTNVLNYLRQIERSELGSFFCAADGTLVFKKRADDVVEDFLTFSDDGLGIPYQTLDNQYGDELLYNYVRTQSPAGAEQVAQDATSITNYQISQLTVTDLLNSSTTEVKGIGQIILAFYKDAQVRFTGFSVQINALSDTDKDSLLGVELTDFAYLTKSFAVGTPSSFTQTSIITGINHNITPNAHQVRFAVENAASSRFMVLGDPFFGVLDSSFLDL
jgi:hypothetical protein